MEGGPPTHDPRRRINKRSPLDWRKKKKKEKESYSTSPRPPPAPRFPRGRPEKRAGKGRLVAWCHAPWHYLPVYYIGTWWHAPAQATAALAANTGGGWIKWEAHLAADACRQPSRCEYRDPSCVWPLPSRFSISRESVPAKFRSSLVDGHAGIL